MRPLILSIKFSECRDLRDLARAVGFEPSAIEQFVDTANQSVFYGTQLIPKRGRKRRGQFRTIHKPRQDLRLLQKIIGTSISAVVTPSLPKYVQGFVKGRSIVSNAGIHLAQRCLLHADIENFFDSITLEKVESVFASLGCNPEVTAILAKLCTLNGSLPQGSCSSPVIANLTCRHLDADLYALASAHSCKYSRYADDITISGDITPDSGAVERIIASNGFSIRDGCCRIESRGRHQYVTGLTIFDEERPRVSRAIKRYMRLELHYLKRFGVEGHFTHLGIDGGVGFLSLQRLRGWVHFINSVEPKLAKKFYEDLDEIASFPDEGENYYDF
jgi:RNA-directed DNA polymerase